MKDANYFLYSHSTMMMFRRSVVLLSAAAAPGVKESLWSLGQLNHVAIATSNLEKSVSFYRDILRAKCSAPMDLPAHGVTTVFVNLGNTKIELLRPLGEKSPIAGFLEKRPEGGIHHVCIEVDNIERALEDVKSKGIRPLSKTTVIGAHNLPVVFLHPKDCGGVLVELEQKAQSSQQVELNSHMIHGPDAFKVEEITFPSKNGAIKLAGSLYTPLNSNSKVCALIVAGSGPVDRYGNTTNFKSRMYQLLAEFLCTQCNFSVFIYDKRGVGKSISVEAGIFEKAGAYDHMEDAAYALAYLYRNCPNNLDYSAKFVLIGHSEGGINIGGMLERFLPVMSNRPPEYLVFLASFGESLKSATEFQRHSIGQEIAAKRGPLGFILRLLASPAKIAKQYEKFEKHLRESGDREFTPKFLGYVNEPTKWYREHLLEYTNPRTSALASYRGHVLMITGQKDIQCRSELCNLQLAKEWMPSAASLTCETPANLCHILRRQDNKPGFLTMKNDYLRLFHAPLDPDLQNALKTWFQKQNLIQ